jgi:hypothetical protein
MIINPYVFQGPSCATPITNGSSLIANGTLNNFNTPAYGFYDFSWSSFIYTAGLIGAARQIRGIEIEVSGYTTPYTFNNQTIKMAHLAPATTQFDAAPAIDWSDMPVSNVTIVKVFNWVISANGIIQILFDTNFCYNGTSNLIIGWENRDGTWTSGYGSGKTISSTNSGAFAEQDNTYPTGNGTRISNRMNLRILY